MSDTSNTISTDIVITLSPEEADALRVVLARGIVTIETHWDPLSTYDDPEGEQAYGEWERQRASCEALLNILTST